MKAFLLCMLSLIWAFPVQADITRESTDALESLIREEIPKGWRVSYEKKDQYLKVSRIRKDFADFPVPNGSGDEKPERVSFIFSFRVHPKMSEEEYRRLVGENVKISQEMDTLFKILEGSGISRKFDHFFAEKEEDKKLVAQYEALRKSQHDIPDFHYRDISLTWVLNSPENPFMFMTDESVQKECEEVRSKVMKLLKTY